MKTIGIDIGTTSVCGIRYDGESGPECAVLRNRFEEGLPFEKNQDPERILTAVRKLLRMLRSDNRTGIGITGQMHGILYTGEDGRALSPLYTWQDGRGDLAFSGGSYASVLSARTGCAVSSGFGAATYYYGVQTRSVPAGAVRICTIGDYIVMRLCGLREPVMHSSNAAGVGCFDAAGGDFRRAGIEKAGMDSRLFPKVTGSIGIAGEYRGAAVACAVGDNQASYIGSAREEGCVLVNIGTGGQISRLYTGGSLPEGTEIRPLYDGKELAVYSSLCGGRAYALLERFFRETVFMATGKKSPPLYDAMNLIAAPENRLRVSALFSGTRLDPRLRGSVTGIGEDNFTPQALIYGTLLSVAEELHSAYRGGVPSLLAGSGSCLRKTPLLRRIVSGLFGAPLMMTKACEEAASGAAFCALLASDPARAKDTIRALIEYEEG